MRTWYDFIGMTPYLAAFLHLFLIGYPLRFGLIPTGWGRGWLFPEAMLPEPCSIFDTARDCNEQEDVVIRDFGVCFILQYELAWVVWYVMRTSTTSLISFHKILLGSSLASVLFLSWLQYYLHPAPTGHAFDADMFSSLVFFHLLALSLSLWTVLTHPRATTEYSKWSIPANAIFYGAVINIFIAIAAFEAIFEKSGGIEQYFASKHVTPVVRISFALAAFYTATHAVMLLRIRTFLTMPQLRAVCLYKMVVNALLPFFWFPELSTSIMEVDQRITFPLRATVIVTYLFGYLWAGKAEGVSAILSSEKEE